MKYATFLFIFYFKVSLAQTIEGIVLDSHQQPLKYVSVGIVGTPYGTVSDSKGKFKFSYDTLAISDTLSFAMLGFTNKKICTKEYIKCFRVTPIILTPSAIELKEVLVSHSGLSSKTIGNKKTNTKLKVNFFISKRLDNNVGSEIGRRFRISKKSSLRNFNFFLCYNDFDTVTFRINIYSIKRGRPYQNLLSKNVFNTIYNKQTGWFQVDLANCNLEIISDIIVSLEWVGHSKNGSLLSIPITFPSMGALHLYKFGSQDTWKLYSNMSSCMTLDVLI